MGIEKYEDIISLSRPSSKRKKMSLNERAAQFSPFAALKGYEEEIEKTNSESEDGKERPKAVYKVSDPE